VAGTVVVTNFSQGLPTDTFPFGIPAAPIAVADKVFFDAPDSKGNLQVWISDGTTTGTIQLTNDTSSLIGGRGAVEVAMRDLRPQA
jgi:ELWxxDGT repeat protein